MGLPVIVAVMLVAGVAAAEPPRPTPKLLVDGKDVYDKICAACHGVTGEGNGPVAFSLKPPPRNFRKDAFKAGDTPAQIFHTITHGLPDTRMVGYPDLAEDMRWAIAFIIASWRPR